MPLPCFSSPVSHLQELSRLMNHIPALRDLLDPLVEQTSFVLSDVAPLDTGTGTSSGSLEYHGTLDDGRLVLLSFYQHSARRTITAEMWGPDDVLRMLPDASIESIAMHHQVWFYSPAADTQALGRMIVAEVTTWLQSFDPTSISPTLVLAAPPDQ